MARVVVEIGLTDEERGELGRMARGSKSWQALARRARVVLTAVDGLSNKEIAAKLKVSEVAVGRWRRRFAKQRADGLYDAGGDTARRHLLEPVIYEERGVATPGAGRGRKPALGAKRMEAG